MTASIISTIWAAGSFAYSSGAWIASLHLPPGCTALPSIDGRASSIIQAQSRISFRFFAKRLRLSRHAISSILIQIKG
jgi:hypothetical protein